MEIYSNESEQTDALRRFFSQNGKALVVGVILGVGALAGWSYWNSHESTISRETSADWQQVILAMDNSKPQTLEAVAKFVGDNRNTYGALASLELAKRYVDLNQLSNAAAQLKAGLKDTNDTELRAVLNLRLARIELQQKQPDEALKTLEQIKGDAWTAIVADVRGEALLSKGDVKGAREVWQQAIQANSSSTLKEMLQMKINNLPG
ncbi:Putative negative regulator of RcsB-dependent stress response [Izhakiella capsodis]|uniref:Ancillary SecYEG translocon subunit n=1 Tax=Izhakiella capsodis TaxID=1367852 RepID=A0A1I4WFU1_9GAMM|nr:YfgM family protein [Izhakiella capsodis]SFN12173.1 Putative negative regulator of RcsB-dependent stress response [Izhakiella capsodis]